jgi:phage major head subunit gpT-like protein
MLYKDANLLFKGIRTEFAVQLAKASPSQIKRISYYIESKSDKEDLLFLGALPGIKEWIDKIQWGDLKTFKQTVYNKKFHGGAILVDRDTLEDSGVDINGMVGLGINGTMAKWQSFPDKLINTLRVAGLTTGLAFDGTLFFAADRPLLKGTAAINNIVTKTGVTLATVAANLSSAMVQMTDLRDKNGDSFNDDPKFLVYIPLVLQPIFTVLRDADLVDFGAGSVTNPYKKSFDIIINKAQLSTDTDWCLINENAAIPPFIHQGRKAPKWNMKDDNEDINVKYWSDSRLNAAYGNPTAIQIIHA